MMERINPEMDLAKMIYVLASLKLSKSKIFKIVEEYQRIWLGDVYEPKGTD